MEGYKELAILDKKINKLLLEKNSITKDNVWEWYKNAKTLENTIEIIIERCKYISW